MIKIIILNLCWYLSTCQVIVTADNLRNITESYTSITPGIIESSNKSSDEVKSFIDRMRTLHQKNGNKEVVYKVKDINETFEAIDNFQKNIKYMFAMDSRQMSEIQKFLFKLNIKLTSSCSSALFNIFQGTRRNDVWAMRFVDSMGRLLSPGMVEGYTASFGDFDECLDSKTPHQMKQRFEGKYCLVHIKVPYPDHLTKSNKPIDKYKKQFHYYQMDNLNSIGLLTQSLKLFNGTLHNIGICVPSVCSTLEISNLLNKVLYPVTNIPVDVDSGCYYKGEHIILDEFQWVSIAILSTLLLLVAIGTGRHIHINKTSYKQDDKANNTLLVSFSLLKNLTKLFEKNEKFAALDTIRFLMIVHIYLSHLTHIQASFGLFVGRKLYTDMYQKVFDNSFVFARNPLPLDALLTLSGFLLSYNLLRYMNQSNGTFNYPMFIIKRWMRFSAMILGSILFIYLFPLTGNGPVWKMLAPKLSDSCHNPIALLKIFLFINNFENFESFNGDIGKCQPVTWFLATLLQLTAISPIFVIIFLKNKLIGIITLITGIVIGLFLVISPYLLFGIKPYLQIWEVGSAGILGSASFVYYHTVPSVYLISFLSGFPFGYLLYKNTIKLSKTQVVVFWMLSLCVIFAEYFWNSSFYRPDQSAPLISTLFWLTAGKLAFSLGIGWLLFACCTGRGGYFNKVLCWQGFQPVARVSFGIYLLHTLVVIHRVISVKDNYHFSTKYMVEEMIIDFVYVVILATIFYLLIEGPFNNLFERIIARPRFEKTVVINGYDKNGKTSDRSSMEIKQTWIERGHFDTPSFISKVQSRL